MNRQRQLSINLLATIVAFSVNIGISFFLTPYIISSLGVEAYGFVTLGTNLINYAALLTLALNSMAGRFITIEIHSENWDEANKYFSSVVLTNIIFSLFLSIPTIFFILFIDQLINVPSDLIVDVKILFASLFLNFLISIVVSSYSVSTFATNRLYLQSLRTIESNLLRALLLIFLFVTFEARVSYIGFAALFVLFYKATFDIYYINKFLPSIKVKKLHFDKKKVWILISSGIWNSVIHLGNIMLNGLNLLIANLVISTSAMGALAVANTIPIVISSLIGTIASVFMPDFTILYAKGKIEELVKSIKKSMKILGLITNIPIAILIAYGESFFSLWVKSEDAQMLQVLSILSVIVFVISGPINSIYNIFTVTNKLKLSALILLGVGIINVPLILILINTTNLGVYAIVLVSSSLIILKTLAFTAPYGAICLGLKWNTFFYEIIKSSFGFLLVLTVGVIFNFLFDVDDWYALILHVIVTSLIGFFVNIIIIFSKSERIAIFEFIKRKIKSC